MTERTGLARELRTPRAAAVAGILFAAMMATMILLVGPNGATIGSDSTSWVTTASTRQSVSLALTLVPFAGIAFLWFIGVIRSHLGAREDKFVSTVFLGSGLLFVACLFSAAAVRGVALTLYPVTGPVSVDTVQLIDALGASLLTTFASRMAAVFIASVTTIAHRTRIVPPWLTVCGYACSLALLVSPPGVPLVLLVFPAWVLVLSIQILVVTMRPDSPGDLNTPLI
ncbi:MAG TPA: hypothetical protein VIC82_07265 [Candidatus Nanopelagicales bacterium]|jgi:hypothetical protein